MIACGLAGGFCGLLVAALFTDAGLPESFGLGAQVGLLVFLAQLALGFLLIALLRPMTGRSIDDMARRWG